MPPYLPSVPGRVPFYSVNISHSTQLQWTRWCIRTKVVMPKIGLELANARTRPMPICNNAQHFAKTGKCQFTTTSFATIRNSQCSNLQWPIDNKVQLPPMQEFATTRNCRQCNNLQLP
eukprot:4676378-Amphidinium_carterae.4